MKSTLMLAGALLLVAQGAVAQNPSVLSREYVYAGDRLLAVAGPPLLSIDDIAVTEGQSGTTIARFTVSLTRDTAQAVTVAYASSNGLATAGSDYLGVSGTATIAAGTTSTSVDVTVFGDTSAEGREDFFVTLSNPVGVPIVKAQGRATIIDDEAARYFPLTPCRVADTRPSAPVPANTTRSFQVTGICGVPATARAVALIVTTVGQTALGDLRVYPAPGPVPLASMVNFSINKARAGNGLVALGQDGQVTVYAGMVPDVTHKTHVVIDVMGYFQ